MGIIIPVRAKQTQSRACINNTKIWNSIAIKTLNFIIHNHNHNQNEKINKNK